MARWLAGARSSVDGTSCTAEHVVDRHRLGPGDPARTRPAGSGWGVDGPRGHRADRGARSAARARRRADRRRDGAGDHQAGCVGRPSSSGATTCMPREPRALGDGVADCPPRRRRRAAARRALRPPRSTDGAEYVLEFADGSQARGDRLLRRDGATSPGGGHRARDGRRHGRSTWHRRRRADVGRTGLWAIGDVTGLWQLTHVGEYQGRVVASNILGRPRERATRRSHG